MAKKPTYKELEQRIEELEEEITKHETAEESLKESEEKYKQLVKYAPSGIFEVDFIKNKFITSQYLQLLFRIKTKNST